MLPRLADPESFQNLKHGYARGGEAQQLVDNVRNYYDILARMQPRDLPFMSLNPAPGELVKTEPQLSTKGAASGR